ncbi:MAG: peptidase C14 [Nitrospirae bacterium]|nr:MAG: peptidase C14 [Nitrospirota bacterium]
MRMKNNFISLISVIFVLFVSMAMTGCASTDPFFNAAYSGDIDAVKTLIEQGADVNVRVGVSGLMPLNYAAGRGHINVVALLIEKGADLNARDGSGHTPLEFAAILGHANITKLLIDKGADIDAAIVGLGRYDNSDAKAAIKLIEKFAKKQDIAGQSVLPVSKTTQAVSLIVKSDIDNLPAAVAKTNKNSYAIVIGIENYRQKLPKADFAVQDAKLMTEYLTKAMGYPEENIVTLLNEHATNVDFAKYFEKWLHNNAEKDGTVFIYYSGHGAPNPKTGDAYLVPYDGDPAFIEQTGYSLRRLYESLGKIQAKEIIVALDSCFSGAGGRSVIAKGARPLVMSMESLQIPQKITVLSAASGDQTSSTYDEKGHGLFTYFMLRGLKGEGDANGDGKIEIGELFNYIRPQVERIARKTYNNEQSPQIIGSENKKKIVMVE